MEMIRSACIKYRVRENPYQDLFVEGPNHSACLDWFGCVGLYHRVENAEEQGFMTTEGRFVDRRTAYKIAWRAGQLISENGDRILQSYNVRYA